MECNDPEPPAKSHQTNCKRKLVKNLTGPGWCSLVELSSLYSTAGTAVYPRHFHPEGGNKQPAGGAPSDGLHLPLTLSGQNIDKSSLRKCFYRALVVVCRGEDFSTSPAACPVEGPGAGLDFTQDAADTHCTRLHVIAMAALVTVTICCQPGISGSNHSASRKQRAELMKWRRGCQACCCLFNFR